MTAELPITEVVEFNPTRQIKRGAIAPFVDMAALPEHQRDISYVAEREFTGGGSRFQNGDTLFARITPCLENGKTAKVNTLPDGSVAHGSTEFIVMAAKAPEYDEDYIYYLARHPEFRAFAEARMEGTSGRQRVSWQALADFSFAFPPADQRKAIGSVLRKFDDKIDLNRRINQTLEAMAQAIFKSWFVDFDPVKAKIAAKQEGRDPLRAAMTAISGKPDTELDALPPEHYEQLAATAALFPDEMEESELGEIPRGWRAKKFGDFIDRVSVGKKFDQKTALVEGLVPILDQGKSGIIGFHNESPGVRASLEKPIVVFANHTCYMRLITFDFSAIQNVLPFVGKDVDTVWAYCATKDAVKFSEYKGHWPDFVLADAVVPQANLTVHFRRILQPLISQMRILELESEKLAVLRDTLLPKLLSGELSVTATTAEAEA